MRPARHVFGILALLTSGGCGTDPSVAPGEDAAVLSCDAPRSITLTPSEVPTSAGVLTAGVGWTAGRCELYADETHADVVLAVADFGGELVAARGGRWVITASSVGAGPTTYLGDLPYDTDISVELEDDGSRLAITFRVEGDALTLVEIRLL